MGSCGTRLIHFRICFGNVIMHVGNTLGHCRGTFLVHSWNICMICFGQHFGLNRVYIDPLKAFKVRIRGYKGIVGLVYLYQLAKFMVSI